MSIISEAARGEMCTLRTAHICNHDPATTVLSHTRRKWNAGVALKPNDLHAFFACYACHEHWETRGKMSAVDRAFLEATALDAVLRTHDRLRQIITKEQWVKVFGQLENQGVTV